MIIRKWWWLLAALLLQLILNPCARIGDDVGHEWPVMILNTLVIITLVMRLSFNKFHLIVGSCLGVVALFFYWLTHSQPANLVLLIVLAVLYLYTIVTTLIPLIRTKKAGLDELFGAAALYILIGLTWAILYDLVELAHPGSFFVMVGDGSLRYADFIYLSFTTLTTLGYGDIVPASCVTRSLTTLETLNGLLCLSVIVGRLISIHVSNIGHQESKE